jgi:hypothetical protein
MRPLPQLLPIALFITLASAANAATFRDLPADVKAQVDLRLTRASNEIGASPFATLTSFEVHGESEDEGVIETTRRLGVKTVVLHNIHSSLPYAKDRRLNHWLDACDKAQIETRCILHSTDLNLWRQALTNYGGRIRHWSFLNEPNAPTDNDHSRPLCMPEKYVELLTQVRKIRDEVAPQCRLWGPETAMLQVMEDSPFPWLKRGLQAGLLRQVDGISIHPYRQGYSPINVPENPSTFEGRPGAGYRTYEEQIAVLRQRTGNKPVAVTEVGWSTTPQGTICENTQAKFALRQQIQDFALGLDCAVYFLLRERHVDRPCPRWHIENHFGIVHTDNTPKPAYTALQTLYSQLDSGCLKSSLPAVFSAAKVKWYLYEDNRGTVPTLKLCYWLPVPAEDNFPPTTTSVKLSGVTVTPVALSDCPMILRLHKIAGQWGYPVLIHPVLQTVQDDLQWQ